ncbi:DUF5686 and carboxypeptidase regulatory-like domain-containing protein [Neolewinella antarctica]|uniref:Carboxypeptidase-like regulatory domain-containing protein n=1 Tax=Neolewinella antarctica TaxID=442734 RepID=A0ABX0X711_9BACT|nr:DUF5686 and carboxypeptidase regulatory-like domain-containing protein [Neolewinella antarctica]NJC24845.1 hypothetical protein [Neolewinella antarctica]
MKRILLSLALLCATLAATAQTVSGRVSNENGEAVPYANIFVQELATGTISDDDGNYTFSFDIEGSYRLIISSLGYETNKTTVIVGAEDIVVDLNLLSSNVQLEEITVRANAKDPAYGIMRKVVQNKARHLRAADSYRTQIYVKATEEIDRKKSTKKPDVEVTDTGVPDPFAAEERAKKELLSSLNLLEMNLTLNFQQPRSYKEERTGLEKYGDTRGLFVPNFGETDFNFYRNMVSLKGIADAPVISPFSNTAILSYKFELLSTDLVGGQIVYKIKVIPRKEGNSTAAGVVEVNQGSWTINSIDLRFSKYALKFFDDFRLRQTYAPVGDSLWIVREQEFDYSAKQGKKLSFKGKTTLSYTNYEHNYTFPPKFFGNEIAVTTREAYERDSSYWKGNRTVALTRKEAELVQLRDSIEAVTNSEVYQDSIQEQYNKVKLLEVAWDGVGFRNNAKKQHLYLGPLASLIDFSPVGGWRIGPYASYQRRYASGTMLNASGTLNYGFENQDVQGDAHLWYRYDAFKLGDVSISGGRSFESINQYDAYLNQLRPSNYILQDAARISNKIELVNGLFVFNELDLSRRQPLTGLDTDSFLEDVVGDRDELLDFEAYEALIATTVLSYTPGLKYLREPDRKIRLGSKWPTFSFMHKKGIDGALGSDIDFDYLRFFIDQNIILGALGTTHYEARVGKFINTNDLRFVDFKRFRESDPLLMSDPTNSFQSLDTSLTTSNLYLEYHHIHHFNGALINNVPLLKKTRIKTVVGGGLLYLPKENFRYQELFVGVERVFKVGARRRLRLGAYGVLADANNAAPTTSFKVSFDLIDLWKRDWSF